MLKVTKVAHRDALIEDLLWLKRHLEDEDNRMIIDGCIRMLDTISFKGERYDPSHD